MLRRRTTCLWIKRLMFIVNLVLLLRVLGLFGSSMKQQKPLILDSSMKHSITLPRKSFIFNISKVEMGPSVTLVTAYFDIGGFQKGEGSYITPFFYRRMLRIFSKINNSVVAFFDSKTIEMEFRQRRSAFPPSMTETYIVKRAELWAFSLRSQIQAIFSKPEYPKFSPNTINPDYSCVMHAKYELTESVSTANPFKTNYIAWIDIGLFRGLIGLKTVDTFEMKLPHKFNDSRIAYSQVEPMKQLKEGDIFLKNEVLMCGAFFIGTMEKIKEHCKSYKEHATYFLNKGLANTDQQVLYAMASNSTINSSVYFQLYSEIQEKDSRIKYNKWFLLGYLSRDPSFKNITIKYV